jgi:hypothetical protein
MPANATVAAACFKKLRRFIRLSSAKREVEHRLRGAYRQPYSTRGRGEKALPQKIYGDKDERHRVNSGSSAKERKQQCGDPRNGATSGPSVGRQAGKDLPIELRVRLPSLAGDHTAITNSLLVYECSSSLLGFEADVFIAGNTLALRKAGGGEYLDTMADSEDPFLLHVKCADNVEQAPIIAKVLRSAAAQNEDGVILTHIYLVERQVGLQTVTRTFDIRIPPWLKIVHNEVEATNRWSSNRDAPVFLPKPMNRIKRLVGFASISGNDQYL